MINEDKPRIYAIPDNFVDESRLFNGMFRTRYFVEGLIMAIIVAIPALLIPTETINTKIMLTVGFATPFFLLGNNGFNGDTISVTIKNYSKWKKERKIMIYNSGAKALVKSPLANKMEQTPAGDKILDLLDAYRAKQKERASQFAYIEGETFEFAPDQDLQRLYAEDAETTIVDTGTMFTIPVPVAHTDNENEAREDEFIPSEIEVEVPQTVSTPVFEWAKKSTPLDNSKHPEITLDPTENKTIGKGKLF